MKRALTMYRAAATLAAAALFSSCADSPVSSHGSGVQLLIVVGSQVAGARTVDVNVGYEVSGGSVSALTTSNNLTVASGTQQVPITIDLTKCLADANHVGGTGICRLRVTVTLKDAASGNVLDVATLPAIDAAPGSAPAPAAITVAAVDVVVVSGLLPQYVVGQTAQASAAVRDAAGNALNRSVTWSSTATNVATVSGSGLFTAVAAGTTQIRASSGGVTASVNVTVIVPVASVTVAPASATLLAGQTVQLVATPRDAAGNALTGRTVTWSSSTNAVTVSANGLVTAVSTGGAVVTATSEGRTGTASITVNPPVASVFLSPTSASLTVGQTAQFTATPRDAAGNALAGRVVVWSITGTAATVSQTGLVTAIAVGTSTVTATSEGMSASATVTVAAAQQLTVSPASLSAGHTVGGTSCPQTLGTLTITSTHTASLTWVAVNPHPAITLVGSTSGTLAPGASASFTVQFNCSQATSFSALIHIDSQSGGVSKRKDVTVTMTVSP
jgi:uncharacterized protein YjdB